MEQVTTEGEGLDLSALLEGGKPDLSALLELVKGTGQGGQDGEKAGGGLDFASLLGMLGGLGGAGAEAEEEKPQPQGPPAFDPALFATFSRAMKAMREPDRNIRLLQALRPFLEPERQKKADEAVKFLHLMKLAPLLQGLSLDGDSTE